MLTMSARRETTRGDMTVSRASCAAMVLMAMSSLPALGRQPLSWDEAVTLTSARRSLANLAGMLSHTDVPLGSYYFLMHLWVRLLTASDVSVTAVWLRLPSALAAIGSVGLLVVLVARWYGTRVALFAGCVLALHPLFTFYAQDARPYALVTFSLLGSIWALLRALDRPSPARLAAYGTLATLTIYLHILAVFAIAAQVLLIEGRVARRRRWLLVAAAVLLAVTPLVVLARRQTAEIGWIPKPAPLAILGVLAHMMGGLAFVLVVTVLAIVTFKPRDWRTDRRTGFLAVWALLPPCALVAADFLTPDLVARYGLVAVPAMAALIAIAVARRRGRLGAALAAAVLAVAATTTAVQQTRPYKYEDYRAAADTVGDLSRPGDAVVFLPMSTRVGFDVYARMEPDLGNVADPALLPGGWPSATDQVGGIDRPPAQLSRLLNASPTLFLLGDTLARADGSLHGSTDVAQEDVLDHYRVTATRRWGELSLTVLQRVATPT